MLRITKTENGMVRGLPAADPRITVFKGIPFAAPPVGELRWRTPQPAADWKGVRACLEFMPIAMQRIPGTNPNSGAFHSSDLWFEFETLAKCWRPFKGKHYDLARRMCNYWTNFARSGDPNGLDADGTPMPRWTPYTLKSPLVMEFLDKPGMEKKQGKMKKLLLEYNKKLVK
jgi:carboxylesterase type B